jgi:hypothetical protein
VVRTADTSFPNTWAWGPSPWGGKSSHWSYTADRVGACGADVGEAHLVPVRFSASASELRRAMAAELGPGELCPACLEIWKAVGHPLRVQGEP